MLSLPEFVSATASVSLLGRPDMRTPTVHHWLISAPYGHHSRDWSEYVNVIGVRLVNHWL